MSLRSWWRNSRQRRKSRQAVQQVPSKRPLREFVYLDEVSLRSLLVSQRDTIPEQVSRAISQAEEAEIASAVSAGNDLIGKGELKSRFQTSNSSSVQTSRKAIVQTLFNELRGDGNIDYALVVGADSPKRFKSPQEIASESDPSVTAPVTAFVRGALVEIEVTLEADPVFKLGTLMSEFTAMAEEYPDMLDEAGRTQLRNVEPVNKVLQHLLAGLIPIRAKADNFSIVKIGDVEYVVHNDAICDLTVDRRQFEIVGVTEHIGYWKDLRRVLFSSARVTMLCRIARDGLHGTWTPVKLADLFRETIPTLVGQINEASRNGVFGLEARVSQNAEQTPFQQALLSYKEKLSVAAGVPLGDDEEAELALVLSAAGSNARSASEQRRAFAAVRTAVEQKVGKPILDPEADLVARQEARDFARLSLFPGLAAASGVAQAQMTASGRPDDRLLDVEVVAIYW